MRDRHTIFAAHWGGCKILLGGEVYTTKWSWYNEMMIARGDRITNMFNIDDCKMILKDLKKITQRDKKDIAKIMAVTELDEVAVSVVGRIYLTYSVGKETYELNVSPLGIMLLASRGYDLGDEFVPKEFKVSDPKRTKP